MDGRGCGCFNFSEMLGSQSRDSRLNAKMFDRIRVVFKTASRREDREGERERERERERTHIDQETYMHIYVHTHTHPFTQNDLYTITKHSK